jgi:DNA polymerase III sliding clamp (beta) subunit (PCNA family)
MKQKELKEEGKKATTLLAGKVVNIVRCLRENEVCIEFTDGARLFVDNSGKKLELSITGARNGTQTVIEGKVPN